MASTAQIRQWWDGRQCRGPHASLSFLGRFPVRVQPEIVEATKAMEAALRATGYPEPTGPTGSYVCRTIAGTNNYSLHAYALAIDVDYSNNRRFTGPPLEPGFGTDPRFRITEAQVNAVEGIVNTHGEQMWRWLGWITNPDPMHFQINVPPDRCQVAATVFEEEDMWPTQGDVDDSTVRRFTVEAWQLKLAALAGHPYTTGSTAGVIIAAGMIRGTYDDVMAALVAAHTDGSGSGIGPREGAQIDAALASTNHTHQATTTISASQPTEEP